MCFCRIVLLRISHAIDAFNNGSARVTTTAEFEQRTTNDQRLAFYLGSSVISCARCCSTAAGENGNANVEPPYHAAHWSM
jgi:hypothetical protein